MLARWEAEGTFAKLREQNSGGPTFSFIDGPVTANRFSLGVHTAWGRTLKDVFQRYKALRGFDQRYQNGFDSQGLWIEVGVERELGLNSKREIEEFGLEEFARRLPRRRRAVRRGADRAARSGSGSGWTGATTTSPSATRTSSTSGASSRPSTSGTGSTWGTARPSGARAAAPRSRSTSWQARSTTSSSRRPVALRPLPAARSRRRVRSSSGRRRRGRCPRTSPPRSSPDAEYGRRDERRVGRGRRAIPEEHFEERGAGAELVGLEYRGPFDDLAARRASCTASSRGTRSRSTRAPASSTSRPGCGAEDFELSRVHDLPVLAPIDESGGCSPATASSTGYSTTEAGRSR